MPDLPALRAPMGAVAPKPPPAPAGPWRGRAVPTPPHRIAPGASAPRLRAHAAGAASAHRGGVSLAAPAALHAAKRASRREEGARQPCTSLCRPLFPASPDVCNPREHFAGPAERAVGNPRSLRVFDSPKPRERRSALRPSERNASALRARPVVAAVGNPRTLRVFDSGGAGRSGLVWLAPDRHQDCLDFVPRE